MIFSNLWRRRTRTLLTMLGIAVGVAAVVALSAFGEGMADGFSGTLSVADADLMVVQKDAVMGLISVVDDQVGVSLKQMPGVTEVTGTVTGVLQMEDTPYFVVKGEDARGFAIRHYRIIAGQPLSGRRQLLLGSSTAENYKKEVGDTFRIYDRSYDIVGIYETGVSFEDNGAVMTLEDAQRAFDKRNQVSYYGVQVADKRRIDEIKQQIETTYPELAATRAGERTQQSEVMDMTRSFGWFLGIFAVLVGGLGMMNTTLMSVFERTREIGVLRAVGWRRRRVIGLLFGESLVLALGGGVLGLALGVGLVELTRLSPSVSSMVGHSLSPALFVQALVIALLLGTIGGIYPAWRASRLEPVEAMRYESGAGGNLGGKTRALARLFGGTALRNLWRRPTRTFVTVAGVGIGVGFIVALMAMADGFVVMYSKFLNTGQMDLMAQQADASEVTVSTVDERVADLIARRPEVKSVAKQVFGMTAAPGLPYFFVFGIDPNEDYAEGYRLTDGRMLERPREILLGRFAANGLKKTVGDTLQLSGSRYRIVGIYENGSVYEDAGGTMSLTDAQQMLGRPRQMSFIGITLNDAGRADEIARQMEADFPELAVVPMSSLGDRLQEMRIMEASINALVLITLIVGGIVMMNAMLMSVFERTQEVGVLRALGWRRRRILGMVLVESVALSLISAVLGTGLGVGLNYLLLLEPTFGYMLAPAFSPRLFAEVLVLALALGTLGGLYPAWRATNLRPVEALRYE
ncbi:MAG: ABC transporter permease [Dehalococcoidales bacterium]|nr:ABC transporter permease [Dehalococcoidales bacterium]